MYGLVSSYTHITFGVISKLQNNVYINISLIPFIAKIPIPLSSNIENIFSTTVPRLIGKISIFEHDFVLLSFSVKYGTSN